MSHRFPRSPRGPVIRAMLAAALGAGVLAVAPAADAASVANVRVHVHRADRALHRVLHGARAGAAVSPQLSQLVGQVTAAANGAASLYRHAHSPAARAHAARAIQMLANQQSRDVTALTPLLGSVPGIDQANLAGSVATFTQGREIGLSVLTQLLGSLPSAVAGPIAGAVASLSSSGTGQIGQLQNLQPGTVVCAAADAFGQIVTAAAAAVQSDVTRIQSLLSMLPPEAQASFTKLLSTLPDRLKSFVATFQQALACPTASTATGGGATTTGTPTTPGAGPTDSAKSMFGAIVQFLGSVVSDLLPSVQSGQAPASAPAPGPLGSVLGGLAHGVPGFGGLPGLGALPGLGGLFGGPFAGRV